MRALNISRKLILGFGLATLLTVIVGTAGMLTGWRAGEAGREVGEDLAPLADAAMEIKLTATTAHLLFEEIAAGDTSESIEEVRRLLDETRFYVGAILEGGQNAEGRFVASTDPAVRAKIEVVREKVERFVTAMEQRYAGLAEAQGVGTGADETFDALFESLVADLDTLAGRDAFAFNAAAQRAVGEARFRLALGHLLVEEVLGGDEGEDFADATASFAAAGEAVRGLPQDDATRAVSAGIEGLIEQAKIRYAESQNQGAAGSEADEAFDSSFESFVADADAAEEIIHASIVSGLERLDRERRIGLWGVLGVLGVAIAMCAGLVAFVQRGISRRLARVVEATTGLAAGETAIDVPYAADRDEVGDMARALEIFRTNALDRERMEAEREADRRGREERTRRMEELASAFDVQSGSLMQALADSAEELQSTASRMVALADDTERQASAVADSSSHATTNVRSVATAAEQLTSSIAEIGQQAVRSSDVAGAAVREAEATNGQVRELAEAVQKIGDVVELINDVAEQTNLLALNATIEAARAGEAGKGFAIVASEVKNLATQTGTATEEIRKHIARVQAGTDGAVTAIGRVGEVIGQISEYASSIASAVEEQRAATQEIVRNVEAANGRTNEVSTSISGVGSASTDTRSSASRVLESAGIVSQRAGEMRENVQGFLSSVKAL